ncbi:short-chain dehydrogenase [Danxiaibacter flavus]|uniref:Short-chain dehydrogenase n=1 Tax=Danxiaibacter flavus TaxID=3049108 RepID=A0ABV3ZL38_9BACT|nr:short-chain dehydrogenase [Chitinophagaceae bacterium DXS]
MNVEEIEKFLDKQENTGDKKVKIDFKKRDSIYGVFVKGKDYGDLKEKNFWRVVTLPNVDAWRKSNDLNFAKIFSGSEFSRLTLKDK